MSAALDTLRLDGRVAIVTGASRGLGRAMALALAGAGADVALAARAVPELEETARAIEKLGRRALVVPTDVTVYSQVETLVERVQRTVDAKNSELQSYAKVKKFTILPEDFTVENGALTPTLKVKRKVISERHHAALDALYK